jgi:hypothetical protein
MDEYVVEEKGAFGKVLDFFVFLSVFIVTIFLVLEFVIERKEVGISLEELNTMYLYVGSFVFLVFAVDLGRLKKESPSWSFFFKAHWLDILATIPFGLFGPQMFEITKLARLNKLLRLSKVAKEFKAASHLRKEAGRYKKKNRV